VPVVRSRPEDFEVEEVPLYAPSGSGGHTFLWVEKRLRNSDEVARLLARAAGVAAREVGFAGRKDRVAVTRQWFSVPGFAPERALALDLPAVRVLDAVRHGHKLRTGQLRGNRFRLVVRDVEPEGAARAEEALRRVAREGLPNRFGPQRFGHGGANVELGRQALSGGPVPRDRAALRFAVSALQAAVFNEALRQRPLPLAEVEPGEVAMVHATGGSFRVEDGARESRRARLGEISATGPIFGSRVLAPTGPAAKRERAALRALGLDPDASPPRLPGLRLRGARRAFRVFPSEVSAEREGDALVLSFALPAGSYASVVLEEVLDASGPDDPSPGPR